MRFPERVLSPEQQAERAAKVLINLGEQIDAWGWECLTAEGRRALRSIWHAMSADLTRAREQIEARS